MFVSSWHGYVYTTLLLVSNYQFIFGERCTCTADEFVCENSKITSIPKEIPCLNGTFNHEFPYENTVSYSLLIFSSYKNLFMFELNIF